MVGGLNVYANMLDDPVRMLATKSGREAVHASGIYQARRLRNKRLPNHGPFMRAGAKRLFYRDAGKALVSGLKTSGIGWATFNLPLAAFSASQAPRGQKAATFASGLTPMIGMGIGQALLGPAGAIAGGFLIDTAMQSAVFKGVQSVADLGRNVARVEMGGDYRDTEVAFTMRQRAAQEMRGSLLNARQYLGREALLMHT